jgi:hypothetical protein
VIFSGIKRAAGLARACGKRQAGAGACDDVGNRGVARVRCGACGAGVVGPLIMEDRGLIRRSLAIGSWVGERKLVFAANLDLWIVGE